MKGKLIVFSAPSGAGKTSIVHALLKQHPFLEFSISATSRSPRPGEVHGVDYFFIPGDEFASRIKSGSFLEWEEVYAGTFYGTLWTEVERIWQKGHHVVFDVDVAGGIQIKKKFSADALSIFIMPPSLQILEERLRNRNTESEESLNKRIGKAKYEMEFASEFDHVVVNDILADAVAKASKLIVDFVGST